MSTVTVPAADDVMRAELLLVTCEHAVVEQFDAHPEAYHAPSHRLNQECPELAKAISAKHKVEDWLWLAVRHNECHMTFEELKESIK